MSIIDLCFPVVGSVIPRDHGYSMYGAVSKVLPIAHGADWLAIHPISGTPIRQELLLHRRSELLFRIPAERIPELLPLSGKSLDIQSYRIVLGVPRVKPLVPSSSLDSNLVVIKLTNLPKKMSEQLKREVVDVSTTWDAYKAELDRQLLKLGISGTIIGRGRRSITVAGRRIIGHSVRITNLSAEDSIRLQGVGLGGKRRMGCGIFRPSRDTVIQIENAPSVVSK